MRTKKKLSSTLIKNYVFFSFTVGIIVFILLVVANYRLIHEFGGTAFSKLKASEVVRQNYVEMPSEGIELLKGWVEILDDHLQIVYIKGKKLDHSSSYSEKELNRLFYDQEERLYHATLAPFETEDGRTFYCLVKIPKEYVSRNFTITSGSEGHNAIFWKLMMQSFILFLILYGINVYIYSRWTAAKITNPLRYIAEGIKHVSNGHYYKRLDFRANYELQQIQKHFNAMAEKLEKTEREKKQLEESKQRMLVDISHDLKTPITTIQGYVEALQRGLIQDEAKRQSTLDLIYTKAKLVTALIEDVFELSKLESPDYPFSTDLLDIAEFIREIAVEFYVPFEEKQFNFQFDIPAHEITVPFNYKLLYRAVSNILSNALTYNSQGTEVLLKLLDDPKHVHIHIIDDGIGISDTYKEKVFDAFVRGDQSRKSDGGTGLGLTISKNIIEKHGGQIRLDTSQGNTMFQITLPK
ncbi:HAMP domain-containing histidine kinase [Paenibacillus profundus]|uniref:histidine kinase n=1 Tax=Paenibacillus profundus TaxID=1173085 RepID=A0ABS8YLI2_9BACL|nr:HAMP domain-containing sensor histidine kinase [Paenibacillus profundus]MCE5172715.1 HAMP domain-containing histidine kinase [Paenibacillus profundus]